MEQEMTDEAVQHSLFSQKCWSFKLPRHEEYKKLINQILLLDKNDPDFRLPTGAGTDFLRDRQQTYVYAWKSDWNIHLSFPILAQLCEDIKPYFNKIIKDEKLKNAVKIDVTQAWINKYEKGDYAIQHRHENDSWVVNYMMKIPKDNTSIFRVHNPLGITYDSDLNENKAVLDINAPEGTVILCPGAIEHSVTPNTSDETRVTVIIHYRLFPKWSEEVKEKDGKKD